MANSLATQVKRTIYALLFFLAVYIGASVNTTPDLSAQIGGAGTHVGPGDTSQAGAPVTAFWNDVTARQPLTEEDKKLFQSAARNAWSYVARNSFDRSGLVRALDNYEFVTTWDMSSAIAAVHSAHGLGLISDAQFASRMDRILSTLAALKFHDNAAPNKLYASSTGAMVGRDEKVVEEGYGWSATDVGRFLVWMKIVEVNHPQYAERIRAIVNRLDKSRITANGYLMGGNVDADSGHFSTYQEGRIGYEQYAAAGYAAWGMEVPNALNMALHAKPVTVYGQTVLADKRGDDRLTSEPYIYMGLEIGFPNDQWRNQARNVLAAQEARYKKTGLVTVVSEDAHPDPPHYFYYYNVYHNGEEFVVDAQGSAGKSGWPRWVSTKASYGWHALFPGDYTSRAVNTVQRANFGRRGFGAGVKEGKGVARPLSNTNLNTNAMILEAAYYAMRGRPLIVK